MVAENACYHGEGDDFFPNRAAAYGYIGFAFGEAGACGQENPQQTLDDWIASPAHNGILIAEAPFGVLMTDGGVGCGHYANGRWTCWFIIGGQ